MTQPDTITTTATTTNGDPQLRAVTVHFEPPVGDVIVPVTAAGPPAASTPGWPFATLGDPKRAMQALLALAAVLAVAVVIVTVTLKTEPLDFETAHALSVGCFVGVGAFLLSVTLAVFAGFDAYIAPKYQ